MNPPAFQFYPDDFIGGVSTMTQAEVGAYILLLCHQWSAGKLSDDVQRIEIVAKGKVSEHVLLKFPRGKNRRLEQEREKQRLFRESRAKNGKLGGRPRKASDNLVVNSVKPTGEPRKSSPSPISNLQSPIKKDIPAGAGDGVEHSAFIKGWADNFKAQWGFDYTFDGGRDGKAVKTLLATKILRIDLLEIAKKAWNHQHTFSCKQASTIHGFCNNLNPIRTELKNGNQNTSGNRSRFADRNKGTLNEGQGHVYAEFMERQNAAPKT